MEEQLSIPLDRLSENLDRFTTSVLPTLQTYFDQLNADSVHKPTSVTKESLKNDADMQLLLAQSILALTNGNWYSEIQI